MINYQFLIFSHLDGLEHQKDLECHDYINHILSYLGNKSSITAYHSFIFNYCYYPYNNGSTQILKHVLESSDLFGYLFVSINNIFLHVKHINTLEK